VHVIVGEQSSTAEVTGTIYSVDAAGRSRAA
jgi:hypothetical protein